MTIDALIKDMTAAYDKKIQELRDQLDDGVTALNAWKKAFADFLTEIKNVRKVKTIVQFEDHIKHIFFPADDQSQEDKAGLKKCVFFTTVFSAKGRTHNRVFWIPQQVENPPAPSKLSSKDRNLHYVALTKSTDTLYVVGDLPFTP